MSEWIHATAKIGKSVQMGHNAVIGENVQVGDHVQIGHHVVIHADTIIGANVRIDDHAVLGKHPMRSSAIAIKQSEDLPPLQIGADTMIGTGAVLYRGAHIGTKCLIADYASVREESSVGDVTIIGRSTVVENKVIIGNHCKVETNVFIPAFSTIGNHCFIAPHVVFTNDNFMGRTEERKKHFKGITIQDGGRLGANATVLPGIIVETDGVAAAGAVVTRHIPNQQIFVGVPARYHHSVPKNQLLENQ
jgi:acetyltransferase-like isoleucine patch superfamily enzyme